MIKHKEVVWTRNNCYVGGYLRDTLEASVAQISTLIGQPYRKDDDNFPDDRSKVNVCWCVSALSGATVTIWDYKQVRQPDNKIRPFSVWYNNELAWQELKSQITSVSKSQPVKFWEITQSTTISQKTTKAIVAAYKQKFGATVWQLFHARIDGRRRYLFPVICGMLAQLVWFEENKIEPIIHISANEKMLYKAQLAEFSCEDTSEFHAYLGVFHAWWVDQYKVHQTSRVKQAIKFLNLGEV